MSCCCPIWGRPRSKGASTWARRSSSTSRPSSTATRRRTACWKPCSEASCRLYHGCPAEMRDTRRIIGSRLPGLDTMGAAERERRIMDQWKHDDRPDLDHLNRNNQDRRRHKTLRTVLLKVLLPLVIVGGSVAVMI